MHPYLIIGGSDAGISAALRIKELEPEANVQMLLADDYPNYSICGIPFYFSREVKDWRTLAHRTRDEIHAQGIEVLPNHWVSKIHPVKKEVQANEKTFPYEKLLIGTGAESNRPPIQGMDQEGVFTLRWIGEMLEIDRYIEERGVQRVTIVGGGYIGIEMADGLRLRGLDVDLVEFFPTVLQTVDARLGKVVEEELSRHGVKVFTDTKIDRIDRSGDHLVVSGSSTYQNTCQLVLVAVGASPNTMLAADAGLALGIKNAIRTDSKMKTNLPDIFAAGDCAETYHALLKAQTYLPLGTTAHKQGRIAGENMLGGNREYKGSLGSQAIKIFDTVVGRTGFHDRDAQRYGIPHLTIESEHWDHKVYYPKAKRLSIRVTANPETRQLLGAQVLGSKESEVAKRIDVFATALHNGYSVEELNDLDLTYTPPLSSPWDPVQMAAQAWLRVVGKVAVGG